MKKINISVVILVIVLLAVNTFQLFSLNGKLDNMDSRLNVLEMRLAELQSSGNSRNSVQGSTVEKEKEVFTPTELAEYMNITLNQVYELIDSPAEGLPYINVGGEYRFGKEAVDDWLKGNK